MCKAYKYLLTAKRHSFLSKNISESCFVFECDGMQWTTLVEDFIAFLTNSYFDHLKSTMFDGLYQQPRLLDLF